MNIFEWFRSLLARNAPEPPKSGGAGASASWTPGDEPLPLGLRQRNPGNVRPVPQGWRGQVGVENGFAVFDSYHNGLRACALVLRNYQRMHGIRTLRTIVSRYAPAADRNNERAYVDSLVRQTGWQPDAALDLQDGDTLAKLVRAVVRHEQGRQPFADWEIRAAVEDALR